MSHRSSRSPVPPTIREEETAEEAAEAEDLPVSESRALRRRKSMQASPGRELTTRQKAAAAKTQIERFNQLLSALSLLHDDSQMAIVYSLAIEAITNHGELKLLAEALHHRWLSDPSFPPICAKVALYFADLELEDHKFGSLLFTVVMGDYKDRLAMRKTSRAVFANSVHFAFQYYFAFRHRGPVYKTMVEPLFDYLHMLLDKDTTDSELLLIHRLFCFFGADLLALNFRETQDLLIKLRHKIIDADLKARVRGKLLEVVDLSYAQFEFSQLSDEQQDFYSRYHVKGLLVQTQHPQTRFGNSALARHSQPTTLPKPSKRRESIIF